MLEIICACLALMVVYLILEIGAKREALSAKIFCLGITSLVFIISILLIIFKLKDLAETQQLEYAFSAEFVLGIVLYASIFAAILHRINRND